MKIWLIRHGATAATEAHLYCGSTDIPLSEKGREALALRRPCIGEEVKYITSGMRRCTETLRLLFGDVPFETDPAFREIDFGAFEMKSYEELKNDPAYLAWITGDNEANIPPRGESGRQMRGRVLAGMEALLSAGEDAVVVTHGGVIAAVMAELFPAEGKSRYAWQPAPGGGYELTAEGGTIAARPLTFREDICIM